MCIRDRLSIASVKSALYRSASLKSAPYRIAPCKLAPFISAPVKSAPLKSVCERSAPLRSALRKSAPINLQPARSLMSPETILSTFSFLHSSILSRAAEYWTYSILYVIVEIVRTQKITSNEPRPA